MTSNHIVEDCPAAEAEFCAKDNFHFCSDVGFLSLFQLVYGVAPRAGSINDFIEGLADYLADYSWKIAFGKQMILNFGKFQVLLRCPGDT